jgi:hypothetical protein
MRIGLVVLTTALATAGAASAADKAQAKPSAIESPTGNREYAKVHFVNPVRVSDTVLMGDYIIEHDNDRMARGQPCTHIYRADDRRLPVVRLYCRHLHRAKHDYATVTLRRDFAMAGQGSVLTEFQFANTVDAHVVPGVR